MTFSGRNYYEIYLLVLTAGWALYNWVTAADGETIEAAFPGWGRHIFMGGLLVGSLVALGGIAVGTVVGMLVERAALFALAGFCGAVGLVVLSRADVGQALYVTPLLLAYAAVHLVRARQVRADISRLRKALAHSAAAEPTP
jgi:hypothetical protein